MNNPFPERTGELTPPGIKSFARVVHVFILSLILMNNPNNYRINSKVDMVICMFTGYGIKIFEVS